MAQLQQAMLKAALKRAAIITFQYRKRYGPVATEPQEKHDYERILYVSIPQAVWPSCNFLLLLLLLFLWQFQYRKRYGPVATKNKGMAQVIFSANGQFQYRKRYVRVATAAWVGFCPVRVCPFQYRKRYVRVATACLETRPQTGLKWQIGKPPRFFPLLPAVSVNTSSFLRHSYASIPVFMPVFVFTKKLENLFSNFPIL